MRNVWWASLNAMIDRDFELISIDKQHSVFAFIFKNF